MRVIDGSQPKSASNFPPEVGKLVVVTASTSGIGFEIALALAQAGADVVVCGRQSSEGHEAVARIRPMAPDALVRFEKLDLESQSSVAAFGERLLASGRPVDLIVNNACTLELNQRAVTVDGFELHLATNFLSHFALTGRLLPLLRASKQPRVMQLTGTGRHHGQIALDDLQLEREFSPLRAYSQSKLAILIFSVELQRRSDVQGWGLVASSAQPLGTRAAKIANAIEVTGSEGWYRRALGSVPGYSQSSLTQQSSGIAEVDVEPDAGARKTLADLIGPTVPEALDLRALDPVMGGRLWGAAMELTGVKWPEA